MTYIVLRFEVESLSRARAFYTDPRLSVVDEGSDRPRIRLSTDKLDLELWEPHTSGLPTPATASTRLWPQG